MGRKRGGGGEGVERDQKWMGRNCYRPQGIQRKPEARGGADGKVAKAQKVYCINFRRGWGED